MIVQLRTKNAIRVVEMGIIRDVVGQRIAIKLEKSITWSVKAKLRVMSQMVDGEE